MAKARTAFGSVFAPQFNLEEHINSLRIELADIGEVRDLAHHSGWRKVQHLLLDLIDACGDRIIELAERPQENIKFLQLLACQRTAYVTLIDFVNAPETKEGKVLETLEKRLKQLRETTGLPRASDMERTRPMVAPASRT